MKILVVSRLSIPATETTIPAWEYAKSLGHTVWVEHPDSPVITEKPDVIICMGVTVMEQTILAIRRFPNVRLAIYHWDYYKCIKDNPRPSNGRTFRGEYDYHRFGNLLESAIEIWVPSECTGRRVTQWWSLYNWYTILSSVPYWDYSDVQDKGYVYCALREIPDPHWRILEQACKELSLPLVMTKHERDYENYQKVLAHCSFLVSHCHELSTGGLSLLEGYYLGKPCLLSNSEWHGGYDYMGDRATYFHDGDMKDLKYKLAHMWKSRRETREGLSDGRDWVRKHYSDTVMIDKILERIQYYLDH